MNSLCTHENILSVIPLFLSPFFGTSNNLIQKKKTEFHFFIQFKRRRGIYHASSGSLCSSITLTVSILSSDAPSIDASYNALRERRFFVESFRSTLG